MSSGWSTAATSTAPHRPDALHVRETARTLLAIAVLNLTAFKNRRAVFSRPPGLIYTRDLSADDLTAR